MTQKSIKIGDFLLRKRNAIDIKDNQFYKRVTIKIKRNGISLRDNVAGTEIGTKKQFTIKQGQFLISKIDARNGAFGIVPKEVDNGIITGNFWTFDIDENIVDRDYFLSFISTNAFDEICEKTSSGTTNRKYLDEKKFLKFEIQIPESIEEQRVTVKKYFEAQRKFSELKNLSEKNEKLIKSLKSSILQDAIQGKLVPQDPSDEPASILIEKIQAEKTKLITEGKLKKQKPLAPIKPEEIPYELPKGWEWVRLPLLVKLENGSIKRGPFGSAITKTMFVPKGEKTYKIYEQGNAIRKTCSYGEYYIDEDKFNELRSFEVKVNDIIISCAGTIGETFVIPEEYEKGIINQALMKIGINENIILQDYFLMLFKAFVQIEMNKTSRGGAIKNLASLDYLKNELAFPLPPIQEQVRIVAKIDEFMRFCELLDEQVKQAKGRSEKLMESVLQGVFNG